MTLSLAIKGQVQRFSMQVIMSKSVFS